MALTPPAIYAELASARAAGRFPFDGIQFDQLAMGVASAVASWAVGQPQNVLLVGVVVGAVGAGAVVPPTSKLAVPGGVPGMMAAFSGAGFNGPLGESLAVVMSTGLGNAFTSAAQYVGPVIGVGVGQDVSKVIVANGAALTPLIMSACTGTLGGAGPMLAQFAVGLSTGLSGMLLTGVGTGTVAGVPGPAPSIGSSISVLV